MIIKFKHKGLKRLHEQGDKSQVLSEHADKIERMLDQLEVAIKPDDINFPGYALHQLKGKMKGYWSITVNGNWRMTFTFEGIDVTDVDLVDYH